MEPLFYKTVRPLLTCFFKIVYRPTIIGKENIPKDGKVVLAGNHTNYFDCLLLISSTKRCIHFLAKDSLMKGFKKVIFKNMGIIPVNRKIHDSASLNMAIDALDNEEVIGIFPEGTINRTNDIAMPFKIGAVKMASVTGCKIIPFSITGKYKPFKHGITIIFSKPMYVDNKEDLSLENDKLRDTVIELIKMGESYGKNK